MKKIIILYDFLKELGGLERVMFFQANVLKKKYNVELAFSHISKKEKNSIIKELELEKGIRVYQTNRGKNEILNLAKSFLNSNKLNKTKSDLVISHSFMSTRIAAKKKKKEKTPLIVFMHHPPNFLYKPAKGWANNPARILAKIVGIFLNKYLKRLDIKSVRNADLVLCNSNYTAKRIKKIYGVKSEVVYPCLSDFFKIITKKEIEDYKKEKNINSHFLLVHGRIIPDKKYEIALDLIKKIPELSLIISGTIQKDYFKKLKRIIKTKNLEKRVRILGQIEKEEVLKLYNSASLFLMTAPKEDFGLTTIEAMACGCPVIAWKDGAGPEEVIVNGSNGFLADSYDINDFAEKIKLGLKKKWDKNMILRSVKKFSREQISKRFLEQINSVIL